MLEYSLIGKTSGFEPVFLSSSLSTPSKQFKEKRISNLKNLKTRILAKDLYYEYGQTLMEIERILSV